MLHISARGKVTTEAVIGFELEERFVEVIIYTTRDLPKPKPLPSSTLLETGGRGATVYNFDLAWLVRNAVKETTAPASADAVGCHQAQRPIPTGCACPGISGNVRRIQGRTFTGRQ
jgi:hypothetical protein